MSAEIHKIEDIQPDHPIEHLTRRRMIGEKMLFAYVDLAKGCNVALHAHESEQIAYVVSGKVKFLLGDPASSGYEERIVQGGEVVRLPSNFPHGVIALEDTVIADILSPPAAMGVDSLDKH